MQTFVPLAYPFMEQERERDSPKEEQVSNKVKRGFASMPKEKVRDIARKGGQAAHKRGTAHEFSSEEAREAGRKGGETVSRDRSHMADIGRKGGKSHRED